MSLLNVDDRISVKQFASIPALIGLGLSEVKRGPISISGASSRSSCHSAKRGDISLEEGCIITKSVRYTHQLIYWVNAAHSVDPTLVEVMIDQGLMITPDTFYLDDQCNAAFLERSVHASLDLYAFIALAPSLQTVNQLIDNVRSDNDRRQKEMDTRGKISWRKLNFSDPSFTDPEYELVVLHPEHFLPCGEIFTVYDRTNNTCANYIVSNDRHLRESVDPNSARLLPFRHDTQQRKANDRVNIFLVAINAEIKFRRYFRMATVQQLPTLPQGVIELMERVTELIDLLYWEPVPAEGSRGGGMPAPPDTQKRSERLLEEHRWLEQWRSMDLEARKAYGTAMMCGHDMDYDDDPAMFEDAFPVNDMYEVKPVYSATESVEAWRQGIVSEK